MDFLTRRRRGASQPAGDDVPIAVERAELEQLPLAFAAPSWLRDLGRTSWLLVGTIVLLVGITWLLGATNTIVGPVVVATIIATVAMPAIGALRQRRVPRAAGAALVLLALLGVGVGILLLVLGGIRAQSDSISAYSSKAAARAQGWLESAGVDQPGAQAAKSEVTKDVPAIISALTRGLVRGIRGLTSLAFALSFLFLSLFFLLKDGPSLRAAVDRHLGVPPSIARTITGGVIGSLRGYFKGVTIVAAFNAVVMGLGALALGVPLAGTIAVVTFVTAYVPYIGAFVSGAFAVVLALGGQGTTTALAMLVIAILANGLLQNVFQPFAMGSALHLHPLVVLIITIGAGCIFGGLGLVLAAPIASAAVRISHDLARARAGERAAETVTAPAVGSGAEAG